jgi:hypothetical protein
MVPTPENSPPTVMISSIPVFEFSASKRKGFPVQSDTEGIDRQKNDLFHSIKRNVRKPVKDSELLKFEDLSKQNTDMQKTTLTRALPESTLEIPRPPTLDLPPRFLEELSPSVNSRTTSFSMPTVGSPSDSRRRFHNENVPRPPPAIVPIQASFAHPGMLGSEGSLSVLSPQPNPPSYSPMRIFDNHPKLASTEKSSQLPGSFLVSGPNSPTRNSWGRRPKRTLKESTKDFDMASMDGNTNQASEESGKSPTGSKKSRKSGECSIC